MVYWLRRLRLDAGKYGVSSFTCTSTVSLGVEHMYYWQPYFKQRLAGHCGRIGGDCMLDIAPFQRVRRRCSPRPQPPNHQVARNAHRPEYANEFTTWHRPHARHEGARSLRTDKFSIYEGGATEPDARTPTSPGCLRHAIRGGSSTAPILVKRCCWLHTNRRRPYPLS